MRAVRRLALICAVALAVPAAAHASGSLSICASENGNRNVCQGAWYFQTTAGDSCGAALLYDNATGQNDGVWIDNETPYAYAWDGAHGRVGMALCEVWGLGRPASHVFIGCYITSAAKTCGGDDGAGTINCCENIAEWYPYHQGLTVKPWQALGACSNNVTGDVNGFLTQQHFGWAGDEPPTSSESATEWGAAISCATAYNEPMGTY